LKKIILTVLIWGSGEKSVTVYSQKRLQLRNELRKDKHLALFSEDIEKQTSNMKIDERIQADEADYIIILPTSPGSIAEFHDFAVDKSLAPKMLILMDKRHKNGYSAKGELKMFEVEGGKVVWFSDRELRECSLIKRVKETVDIVQKVKYLYFKFRKN